MAIFRSKEFIQAQYLKPDCSNIQDVYVLINGRRFWDKYIKTQTVRMKLIQAAQEQGIPFPNKSQQVQAKLYPGECIISHQGYFSKVRYKDLLEKYQLVERSEDDEF